MKIGFLADIHGNHCAFHAVLGFLHERVQQIFFAGDVTGYYPFVHECLAAWDLQRIVGVRGNHDQVMLDYFASGDALDESYYRRYGNALERSRKHFTAQDASIIRSWDHRNTVEISGLRFLILHGAPWDNLDGRIYPDFIEWNRFNDIPADIIVLGHTHYPFVKEWKGKLIVNPGSVGQPRNAHGPFAYCAEIDMSDMRVFHHRIAYDAGPIVEDAQRNGSKELNLERYLI